MKTVILLLLSSIYLFGASSFISATELHSKLQDKNLVLLDITDAKTYAKGHIVNAINANVFDFRKQVGKYQLMRSAQEVQDVARSLGINNDSYVVIYGHGKAKELLKSSYLALSLIVNGLKEVSILDGGIQEFEFDYKEMISKKTPAIKEGNFVAKRNPNVLVDLHYVKEHIGKVPLIESRPYRYFTGEDQSKGVRRLGHIPTAQSSFWKDKFLSDETVFSNEELKSIFIKGHHLNPNKEVIVYCTGGLEASMNWYLMSQTLGFKDAKLYDASMREWGNRDDTPMVTGK